MRWVDLAKRIIRLNREITSKQHERWAISVAVLVMALAGSATALRLRNQTPLVVYLWSFLPSLLAFIMISSGQQYCHSEDEVVGLALLWSGVGGLGVYGLVSLVSVGRG